MVSVLQHYRDHMAQDDKDFFAELGARITALRKEQNLTQVQLAGMLGISQQLMTAHEAGLRKVPASMLPPLCAILGCSVEALLGMTQRAAAKRGPLPKLQQQIEQISRLPKTKQRFVMEMLETVIQQAS